MNWIKCSERQPSKSGSYLATYKVEGAYYVDFISYYKVPWEDESDGYDGWATMNDVVAWIDEELEPYNETMEDIYSQGYEDGWNVCLKHIKEELDYWEKENEAD